MSSKTPPEETLSRSTEAPEKPIISPCVSVCALNSQDLCTGCYRTGDEISQWGFMENKRRREVLAACHEREKQYNPFL